MAIFIDRGTVANVLSDGQAVVDIQPEGFCPESHSGCPVRALSENSGIRINAKNPIKAKLGDNVLLRRCSPHYYKSLFIVFILPLIGLFFGYLVGSFIAKLYNFQGELVNFIFMFIGFVAVFPLMRLLGRNCEPEYTIIDKATKNFLDRSYCNEECKLK